VRFRLRWPFVAEPQQQANNEDLLAAVNQLGQFVSWGDGAPAHTPDGPEIYFEQDGPGVHIYNGAWVAL
jgi:hypothetical protein